MNMRLLCSAPHLAVYFDSWNNWLYVEWEGDVTLPVVQVACLEVAQCFIQHSYPRILNSDVGITSMSWDVAPWLVEHFLPGLAIAGIEQMAWVYAPTMRGHDLARRVVQHLQHLNIALFSDVEEATTWLQQTRPEYVSGCALLPRPAALETQLQQLVAGFRQALTHTGVIADANPS